MSTSSFLRALQHLASLLPGSNPLSLIERLRNAEAAESEWRVAGELLLRSDPAAAASLLEVGVQNLPDAAQLHYLHGNALRMSGQPAEAEIALDKAISLDPAHANASVSLAHLLREQGRMKALAKVMLALWHHEPRSLEADRRVLSFLCECARHEEADSLLPALLADPAQDPLLLRRAGEIALSLGRFEEAQVHLRAALALDPDQASTWLRLAHTHQFVDPNDEDLRALQLGAARPDLAEDTRIALGFALGKALDDLGEIAESVNVFRRANADWRKGHRWDRKAWQHSIDAQMHAPAFARSQVSNPTAPVFIVGLPRSGTTLVETLLARDAQIRSRGELNWIAALARQLGPRPSSSNLTAAGNFCLAQLRQDDAPARFHIDKNPLNFRHLGLIAAMLPHAKIIHCRRDLRDTALSLWSQHFAHEDMAWGYDFGDIADYARGQAALMAHWRKSLPVPILELDYESLVGEPDSTIARVRGFLGLESDAPAANFEQATAISTASVWQARQQVHSRSVGRWRRYSDFLPELADIGD
ncbi:MAG: sulfotransferase [Dokdonella sp.]